MWISAFKRNNTVEHDANSVLEGFKKYYSTLADTLGTLVTFNFGRLPKAPNKYSIDTVIKYYKHVIQGYHFDLASVSENPILFKINSSFKSSWSRQFSGSFLKGGAKVLAKPVNDLCNLSINSEKFPDLCKVAKRKPLYKKGYLTQTCNYKPLQLHIDLWNPL